MSDKKIPTTPTDWREIAKDGYPSTDEYGPYPCVMVAMACEGHPDWSYSVRPAELRFFGRDKKRPFWTSPFKKDGYVPIENDAWYVTHWAPYMAPPEKA